jgi:hypothetical protein
VFAGDPQELPADFDPIVCTGEIEPVERDGVLVVGRTHQAARATTSPFRSATHVHCGR